MTDIAIYMEGGGDSADSKAAIRIGMSEFLREIRDRARARRCSCKVVACGGRGAARDAFLNAVAQNPGAFNVLLVDAEAPVVATPRTHLRARDGWELPGSEERYHLMVQTMETWIVADPQALEQFYGQAFRAHALPAAIDLETVAKADVARALEHATRDTQKGRYHKILHAKQLLERIDPERVRGRCRHCRRLFEILVPVTEGP